MKTQMLLFPDPPRRWNWDVMNKRVRRRPDGRGRTSESLAAHEAIKPIATGRRAAIRAWLFEHGPATDREIRDGLYPGQDMNMVRPRVTELLNARGVIEDGRVRDAVTGMTVRRVRAI